MARPGYTMIELVTALLVLGVLAGVVAPRVLGSSDEAIVRATYSELKTIALAAEMYRSTLGDWPPEGVGGGVTPVGMEAFLRPNLFDRDSPVGGNYDWDKDAFLGAAAISVNDYTPDWDKWNRVDELFDDGNPNTGQIHIKLSIYGFWRLGLVLEP